MFTNITSQVQDYISNLNTPDGLINIYTPHSTCAVKALEDELLHLLDIRFLMDKFVPFKKMPEGEHHNVKYMHDMISLRSGVPLDERINGHSHLRTLFFDTQISIPFSENKLILGSWLSLFFVELDPCRDRIVYLNAISVVQ